MDSNEHGDWCFLSDNGALKSRDVSLTWLKLLGELNPQFGLEPESFMSFIENMMPTWVSHVIEYTSNSGQPLNAGT